MNKSEKLIQVVEGTPTGYAFIKNLKGFVRTIEPALPNGRYLSRVNVRDRQVTIGLYFEKPVGVGQQLEDRMKRFIQTIVAKQFRNNISEVNFDTVGNNVVQRIEIKFLSLRSVADVQAEFKQMNTRSRLDYYKQMDTYRSSGGGIGMSMRTMSYGSTYDEE